MCSGGVIGQTSSSNGKWLNATHWTFLLPLLVVAAALIAYTPVRAHAANTSDVEKALLTLDQKRADAQVRADIGVLEAILGDDLTFVHASGAVQSKADFLADLKSGKRVYKSVKSSGVHVRVFGHVAVITGESDIIVVNDQKEHELSLRVTEVYADRNRHWQMIAYQSTRMSP
jgi:hypothetical protein